MLKRVGLRRLRVREGHSPNDGTTTTVASGSQYGTRIPALRPRPTAAIARAHGHRPTPWSAPRRYQGDPANDWRSPADPPPYGRADPADHPAPDPAVVGRRNHRIPVQRSASTARDARRIYRHRNGAPGQDAQMPDWCFPAAPAACCSCLLPRRPAAIPAQDRRWWRSGPPGTRAPRRSSRPAPGATRRKTTWLLRR